MPAPTTLPTKLSTAAATHGLLRAYHPARRAKTYRNFAAEYARLQQERVSAFREFVADVNSGTYPAPQHDVAMTDAAFDTLRADLGL